MDVWSDGDSYEAYMGRWSRPVADRFLEWLDAPAGGRWLDVGCGTGTLADEILGRAAPSTVLGLDPSPALVAHAAGHVPDPRAMFANSDLVRVDVSGAGFARLAHMLDATFARGQGRFVPEELGPGLYGTSLFFRANGTFHLFRVCNHWIADLLDAAGVPTAPVLATLPSGLLFDLKWRSGLVRLPLDGTA